MPQQDVRAQVVRGPLADISVQFKNTAYVADQVFPIVPVDSPRSKIWVYDKGAMFRNEAGYRAAGGRARRGGMTGTWVNVTTAEYAKASEVTVEDRKYAKLRMAPPLQPDIDAVEYCAGQIDLFKEILVKTTVLGGTWADGNSGGEDANGLWAATDGTNTMLTDVHLAFRTINAKIGKQENLRKCLLVDDIGFDKIIEAFSLQTAHIYTSGGRPTAEWLKNYLQLDELIVAGGYYDSGNEKKAGGLSTSAQIWATTAGKGVAFAYVKPASLGLKSVIPGLQVREVYDGDEGGGVRRTTSWEEPAEHQTVYEVAEQTDIVQVCAEAGYLWKDITTD